MHNCKKTRSRLIDLAFNETRANARSAESARLLAELKGCSDCQREYASLCQTFSVVDRASRSAMPPESFWPDYHSRLNQRLKHKAATDSAAPYFQPRTLARVWLSLAKIARTSVRIPVPVAAAVFLFIGVLIFLAMHARDDVRAKPLAPAIAAETRTVEVPVIREKVLTRVVYVAKTRRLSAAQLKHGGTPDFPEAVAGFPEEPTNKTTLNLSGFRPTDQVKLTIIKGSYHDEK